MSDQELEMRDCEAKTMLEGEATSREVISNKIVQMILEMKRDSCNPHIKTLLTQIHELLKQKRN